MKIRKAGCLLLLLGACLALSGCRVRTTVPEQAAGSTADQPALGAEALGSGLSGAETEEADEAENPKNREETGRLTKENPEASRKEYDESAPVEVVPGTGRKLHDEGEGEGVSVLNEAAEERVSRVNAGAEETAVQTVDAEKAEQKGASEDAPEADSAMTYYSVLLQDRTGSLYECQRTSVYWETAEDHVTVYKSSPEHSLILGAGANDVSSRLQAENLHVDDGWIVRKNPGLVVKVVGGNVLGTGVSSDSAARSVYAGLLAREGWAGTDAVRNKKVLLISGEMLEAPHLQLAAMLLIAETANPELFPDADPDRMIALLTEEAAGSAATGHYYYNGQGGF
ncbi:MAG: hypothetical protein IJG94_11845 [Clostridia bacterium]|nr:hypothetical protein [Clostridia bacterium]